MAKQNLGRVQGASLFYYDDDASILVVNRNLLTPNDLVPMIGDTIIDNGYSIYSIIRITNNYLTLKLDTTISIDSGNFLFASAEEIRALFEV